MKHGRFALVIHLLAVFACWPFATSLALAESGPGKVDVIARFNHQIHEDRVFKVMKIDCAHCHNFKVDQQSKTGTFTAGIEKTVLNRSLKAICHECHQGAEAKYRAAPKTCFTCHRSVESLQQIKPRDHMNIGWNQTHSTAARANGESCMNCHTTSQCVQCHQRRNDIEFKNHSRNFRFTHSVVARAQPHRCDTCHSKSFCTDCHVGKR